MSEIRQLVEQHYRNMNEQAWSRESEVLSPEVVTVQPGGTINGIDGFLEFAKAFWRAFPDGRLQPKLFIEEGNRLMVEGVHTGTHTGVLAMPNGELPPTGKSLVLPYSDIFEAAAGRIVGHRVYWDEMTFAVQLGLMPAPQSAS